MERNTGADAPLSSLELVRQAQPASVVQVRSETESSECLSCGSSVSDGSCSASYLSLPSYRVLLFVLSSVVS